MEEELTLGNILETDEVDSLFADDFVQESPPEENSGEENETTENVNPEELFSGEDSESVGSEEEDDDEEEEDTQIKKGSGTPPNNFYSSIANALEDEGIFHNLSKDKNIETPEDFAEAIENEILSRLDDKQRRIAEALNADVDVTEIRKYENALNYLDSISDEILLEESERGENLRKQLIITDLYNRGYSKERAERELKKSLDSGSDIEDAKDALVSNKQFFGNAYNNIIENAKKEEREYYEIRQAQAEELKTMILNVDKAFGDVSIDKATRQKAFEIISKPVYKDTETGELFTELQRYERENRNEFLQNVGLLYALTNGFKDIDKIVKSKVQKETRKSIRNLEHTLNNTMRDSDGSMKFVTNSSSTSPLQKGWDLDL